MRVVSLFSGIGAYERALKNVGIDVELVNYCEILKDKSRAYSTLHNVSEEKNLWDVTKIDTDNMENFDLLVYSPPCFTAGHLVMTDKGYKKIEDIVEGDLVLTHKGRFRKVLTTMCKETNELYRVKVKGVSPYIECTAEHPFYVKNRKIRWSRALEKSYEYIYTEPFWKEAKDLKGTSIDNSKEVDYLGVIHNLEEPHLPIWNGIEVTRWKNIQNTLTEKFTDRRFWYMVGRFLGDGWTRIKIYPEPQKKNRHEVRICCSHNEIEGLKEKIGDLFNYTVCNDRTTKRIVINNKELTLFMTQFGHGAKNKHFTDTIFNLPIEYLREVFNGMMDSDGCFDSNENRGSYGTISKELAYGFAYILKRLGYTYDITYYKRPEKHIIEGREVNQNSTYTVRFKEVKGIRQSFFENDILWNPVRKTEKVELENSTFVYNLEVEEDNSYTVENVIVHNCQSFSISGKMKGLEDLRGTLFYNALEVIKAKMPKYCVMENVANLAGKRFEKDFEAMRDALEMLGYNNYWKCINAKDFIPQNRERVYLVSIRKDIEVGLFEFPAGRDSRNWWDVVDLSDMRPLTNRQQRMVDYAMGINQEDSINLEGDVQFDNAVITLRQSGLRFQSNREYPTITAFYGKGGGNFTIIARDGKVLGGITPRNCFKLMGFEFEDSEKLTETGFSNSSQYIMAGDSVCVPVLEGIFDNLFNKNYDFSGFKFIKLN